jgi:hypothetical protein
VNRRHAFLLGLLVLAGCGAPSEDERENRKAFEFLLTAVSLKNAKELEKDARRIDERHAAGKLSDARHRDLKAIIEKARAGDWGEAERMAYEFREAQPFFK